MGLFSLLLFVVLYMIASLLQEKDRARDVWVSQQIEKRSSERELFKSRFGADDELILEALNHEWKKTDLAETIRLRLLREAEFDHKALRNCLISQCHPIALGILAQSGKIPVSFIDNGVDWSKECWTISPNLSRSSEATQMMERFIRWYDKELTDHGVTEHLFQKQRGVRSLDSITDSGYLQQSNNIQNLDSLRFGEVLFWPSIRSSVLIGGSLRRISYKLIK